MFFKHLSLQLILLIGFFGVFSESHATEPLNTYFDLLDAYPSTLGPLGNWQNGEIEIIRDLEGIAKAKANTAREVGIIARDNYWIWVNDAVRFPNGKYGVYGRILWTHSLKGPTGVAVMCLLPDQRIVLNYNYRHATRSWELELPRGGVSGIDTIFETARKEVHEETGMVLGELSLLGDINVDTGITNAAVSIFLGKVIDREEAEPEDSEAIKDVLAFPLSELLLGISQGEMQIVIKGQTLTARLRDPFLAYAILQAQLKGLIQ